MNRFVLTAAVACVGLGMGLAAPAHADGTWAAIAASPSQQNYDVAWGPATKDQAEQTAAQRCNTKAKKADCTIVASSADCVAVAQDGSGLHGGIGSNPQAASANAVSRSAAGAKVLVAKCSTDPVS